MTTNKKCAPTTPLAQKEYIITDSLIEEIKVYLPTRADYLLDKLRSHPFTGAGSDAVLKGFERWLDDRCLPYGDRRVEYYDLKSKLIELRQQTKEREQG